MRRLIFALVVLCTSVVALRCKTEPASTATSTGGEAFGFIANATTKFLFLTHRRSGTNLMQQLCNLSALMLSNGTEQCHWCFKVLGQMPNGNLRCPPDDWPGHGPHRSSGGRFTLVSTINAHEFEKLRVWAPHYRAVHMVRDPVQMIVSDYLYNERLIKTKSKVLWDSTLAKDAIVNGTLPMDEAIRNLSLVRSHWVDGMCKLQLATKDDPNMLEMDLGSFQTDFPQAARRLFSFLFGEGHVRMADLLRNASRWDLKSKRAPHVEAVSDPRKKPAVEARVHELLGAGDRMVTAAASCRGAAEAAPWAGKMVHHGSSPPIDQQR